MTPVRVAIIADYLEEGWPSMDLVADMLLTHLQRRHQGVILPTLIRPKMPRRLSGVPFARWPRLSSIDRVIARQWDYPRTLRRSRGPYDVYHVIDHTYAHLTQVLPAARTIVTCHDIDAFRSVLVPEDEPRSAPYRRMARRILNGLHRATRVACDSAATRDALESLAGIPPSRLIVIPNGADTGGYPEVDSAADHEAARILGPRGALELLHVGSTIPRKRIDVLLEVFAEVRRHRPEARLVRVGGPFTAGQRVHARNLGVFDAIAVLPFVDRVTLAAVYRRAAVALLPSEREGFGLPLVEALACGTPVIATDIPVLREVGSDAVTYAPLGDVDAWSRAILRLLGERETDLAAWASRRARGLARAAEFSWSRYADDFADLYCSVAGHPAPQGDEVESVSTVGD
jgi:glycosyltransferase involved in cell wall biosynthesis